MQSFCHGLRLFLFPVFYADDIRVLFSLGSAQISSLEQQWREPDVQHSQLWKEGPGQCVCSPPRRKLPWQRQNHLQIGTNLQRYFPQNLLDEVFETFPNSWANSVLFHQKQSISSFFHKTFESYTYEGHLLGKPFTKVDILSYPTTSPFYAVTKSVFLSFVHLQHYYK